ncbi:uncharacterized protein LOC111261365 isoform X1 [Varroa jacobsoni]|uniref:uncharacterized protein LOC111261365 isoform X1 n=2 Tax=Varroa jacobsoni TaxID=62625 RepID=UPI000BF5B5A1|nr:uncharacterized protein LOC111261365 isoform X1 [Varroa jacobsoni]
MCYEVFIKSIATFNDQRTRSSSEMFDCAVLLLAGCTLSGTAYRLQMSTPQLDELPKLGPTPPGFLETIELPLPPGHPSSHIESPVPPPRSRGGPRRPHEGPPIPPPRRQREPGEGPRSEFSPVDPVKPTPAGFDWSPGPLGLPSPPGPLADDFPPLEPNDPKDRNVSRHRNRSPGSPDAPRKPQPGRRGRYPSRSPSPSRVSAVAPAQASPAGAAHDSYSHLIFAIQWSGGVCADRRSDNRSCIRDSLRNHWTIHGLWPSNEYKGPLFCDGEKFDGRLLNDIKDQLNQYWPSYTSTQDRFFTFWRHEWQKHGACAADATMSLVGFFTSSLRLYKRHDINEYLRNSNVIPSKQKVYHPSEIVKAIMDDYPYKIDVVCNHRKVTPHPVLTEVRFCLNKSLQPVNCNGRYIRCENQLVYLPNE